jgi:hypothetical protein
MTLPLFSHIMLAVSLATFLGQGQLPEVSIDARGSEGVVTLVVETVKPCNVSTNFHLAGKTEQRADTVLLTIETQRAAGRGFCYGVVDVGAMYHSQLRLHSGRYLVVVDRGGQRDTYRLSVGKHAATLCGLQMTFSTRKRRLGLWDGEPIFTKPHWIPMRAAC